MATWADHIDPGSRPEMPACGRLAAIASALVDEKERTLVVQNALTRKIKFACRWTR
jgi:hypothetical protein